MKRCSCKKSSSIKSSNVEKAWNWPRSEKVTVGSYSYSTLEQNPGLGIFQRIFNIVDTVTTKMIPESSNKTGQVFKFFTEVNWPVFIPRKIWIDQSYVSLFWMINRKTKTFRFEKKLGKKQKYQGFQRDEKNG